MFHYFVRFLNDLDYHNWYLRGYTKVSFESIAFSGVNLYQYAPLRRFTQASISSCKTFWYYRYSTPFDTPSANLFLSFRTYEHFDYFCYIVFLALLEVKSTSGWICLDTCSWCIVLSFLSTGTLSKWYIRGCSAGLRECLIGTRTCEISKKERHYWLIMSFFFTSLYIQQFLMYLDSYTCRENIFPFLWVLCWYRRLVCWLLWDYQSIPDR